MCAVAKLYNVIDSLPKAVLAIARSVGGRGVTWCVQPPGEPTLNCAGCFDHRALRPSVFFFFTTTHHTTASYAWFFIHTRKSRSSKRHPTRTLCLRERLWSEFGRRRDRMPALPSAVRLVGVGSQTRVT